MKKTQTPELQVPNLRVCLSWLSLGEGFTLPWLSPRRKMDLPALLLLLFTRSARSYICTSLAKLLASVVLSFLPYSSLSWFCLPLFSFFFLLENSTDKGSSLSPVLCNGHVRNACSILPINSEESSHGLCANEWKLLYSNKTLFIDLVTECSTPAYSFPPLPWGHL